MKAVIVFMLLFAAVYCHPVKRSASSSESADVQPVDTQGLKVAPVADVSSEEDDDADDADDDDSDSDESDENVDPTSDPTSSPPTVETTVIPVINGRGDSIGYQSDYKKPGYYMDGNNIEKGPSSYKSYGSDKNQHDGVDLKLYKALQVHDGLDQGLDVASGTDSGDTIQQEQKSASSSSASDATPSLESDEDSQSSEEGTTEATTIDSNSSESSEENNAADQPALLSDKKTEVIVA